MSSPTIRLEREENLARLTFDQPGRTANILTLDFWLELEERLIEVRNWHDLRGVILTSAKPGIFVAGADLKFLAQLDRPKEPTCRTLIDTGLRVLAGLESLPVPTLAIIDGVALGGGLELALACDVRLVGSGPQVRLGLPEVQLGLIPGWGGTQRLPRIIAPQDAWRMLLTGESLNAEQAVAVGLAVAGDTAQPTLAVNRLVESVNFSELRREKLEPVPVGDPPEEASVDEPTSETASRLRSLLIETAPLVLAEGIAKESELFHQLAGSPEAKQLIAAFMASRAERKG